MRSALGHHRATEADHTVAILQQSIGHSVGDCSVVEHHGDYRVSTRANVEAGIHISVARIALPSFVHSRYTGSGGGSAMSGNEYVHELGRMLESCTTTDERLTLCRLLSATGSADAQGYLTDVLADEPDEAVAEAIRDALTTLTSTLSD